MRLSPTMGHSARLLSSDHVVSALRVCRLVTVGILLTTVLVFGILVLVRSVQSSPHLLWSLWATQLVTCVGFDTVQSFAVFVYCGRYGEDILLAPVHYRPGVIA
eukprot:NODE_4845_length_623_cov_15.904181_g4171_i0.p1 GENE.NODE_4845_length_623_cov_15.904181_g4171_i0~~NODE_4845_length_623_cov_15.904181_g4171_i0.p1  ORF type:complete len:104 (-),score=23.05 NODE_4845_length_623_cov_15.904181_g4171_i0:23-334(-)